MNGCTDCGATLTAEERYFYENRCEVCERSWSERIGRWRAGNDDAEFDSLFGGEFTGHH